MRLFGREISFRRGQEKMAKRRSVRYAGGYSSAQVGRLTNSMASEPISANAVLVRDLTKLRARSRAAARNNDYARRYIALAKSNVVGPKGVQIQARITDLDGSQDEWANNAVEAAWAAWGRAGLCDLAGRYSWVDVQALTVTGLITDGEVLIRKVYGGPHGFQVQVIDPELLDVTYNETLSDGRRVVMGVELDANETPIAYHIKRRLQDSWVTSYYDRQRVPASEILHIYLHEFVGQYRGCPSLATSLLRMEMLEGYHEAALVNARMGASKMGFYKTTDGSGFGDEMDANGDFIDEATPGHFTALPPGYEFTTFDPAYPSGEFESFVKAQLQGIASGLSVGYNALSSDLQGVSYSSIRTAVLEDREVWKALQDFLVERLVRPVREEWLLRALLNGKIVLPTGKALPANFAKFSAASYQPRRWSWIDPLKDMQANIAAIENGLTTRGRIIREMGADPDEVWAELEREQEKLQQLGLLADKEVSSG